MRLALGATALAALASLGGEAAAPPSPVFHRTQDSDEWVAVSFEVQGTPARVLVVDGSGARPETVDVRRLDLNARGPRTAAGGTLPVFAAFVTLQDAADAARGGDLVAVLPGHYAGFVLGPKDDAGDGRYVHFQAEGKPGEVVIDRPGPDPDWMVLFQTAHHAILDGFNVAGHTGPGLPPEGPRAGIMIDGDFGRSGRLAHHIALVGNFSHNHRKWGFHSTDTHTVLIQDNLFAFSAEEHSGYASDGSDDYVIRRNVFFGSRAGGLQCNIDSVSSFHEVLKHPAFRDFPAETPTRAWALALVERATELFGARAFPDGWGVNFIIEDNVVNGNGRGGGGSLNLAALSDSLVQNNLIYGNFNHGIAQWDDANPYDAAYVDPGPRGAEDVKGPESLPLWGCHRNVIRNNTVLMANAERAALQFRNGSWGGRARNNLLINDGGASIEVFGTSVYRLDSGFNVAGDVSYNGMPEGLKTLAVSLDETSHSMVGVRRAGVGPQMERDGDEPWVVVEGDWWRLNPARPDFRPRSGSTLLAGRGDPSELPTKDLTGLLRSAADIGAFAAAPTAARRAEAGR